MEQERKSHFVSWCATDVQARLSKIWQKRKKFTLLSIYWGFKKILNTFYHFSRLDLYFPDLFQVWKNCWANLKTSSRIQDSVRTVRYGSDRPGSLQWLYLHVNLVLTRNWNPYPVGQITPVVPSLGEALSAPPIQWNPGEQSFVQISFPSPAQYLPAGQLVQSLTFLPCVLLLNVPKRKNEEQDFFQTWWYTTASFANSFKISDQDQLILALKCMNSGFLKT